MRRVLNSLAVAIFALGVVVAPAIHHAHLEGCAHGCACSHGEHGRENAPKKHDAEHCQICQLALTPLVASAPVVVLAPVGQAVALHPFSIPAPAVSSACVLPYSCGPPA